MEKLVPLTQISSNHEPIARSLPKSSNYQAHWRALLCARYLDEIASASQASAALTNILSNEHDFYLKKILLFHSGKCPSESGAIEYALRCHRSQKKNATARNISALVVAGQSPEQIADYLCTEPLHILFYEALFFDVRRYREHGYWMKPLCYDPGSFTGLGDEASRSLVTALERGPDALALIFSTTRWERPNTYGPPPVFKDLSHRIYLGLLGRLSDDISAQELSGKIPDPQDVELHLKVAYLTRALGPTLSELCYPIARSPKEEKKHRATKELLSKLPLQVRKNLISHFERRNHENLLAEQAAAMQAATTSLGQPPKTPFKRMPEKWLARHAVDSKTQVPFM